MKNKILIMVSSVAVATLLSGCWGDMNNEDEKNKLKHITAKSLSEKCELATFDEVVSNLKFDGKDKNWLYGFNKDRQTILKDGFLVETAENEYEFYKFENEDLKIFETLEHINTKEYIVDDFFVYKACAKDYTEAEKSDIVFISKTKFNDIDIKLYKNSEKTEILRKIEFLNEKYLELLSAKELAKSKHILLPLTLGRSSIIKVIYPKDDKIDTKSYFENLNKLEARINNDIKNIEDLIKREGK